MLSAKYFAKIGDAGVRLRHITALRLPIILGIYQQRNRNLVDSRGAALARLSVNEALPDVPPSKPPRIDGRRLRSERTKQLIIEAFLSLLRDNPQMPTAVQIAERAGYSVRSIFERFPDLNALRVAATDYSLAQALALAPPRGADGDRETRLRSQVNDPRPYLRARHRAVARAAAVRRPGRDRPAQAARRARPRDDGRAAWS